jgi:1,2-diacylglycerol 3-alpha-glucosyltransferase
MVVACPFPANYGTPGAIREMSGLLAQRGHRIHVVTYPGGEGTDVGDLTIWRSGRMGRPRPIYSGPSFEKPVLDLLLLKKLLSVIRREKIDIIHAHHCEGAVIGAVARILTGKPLVFHAHGLMSDELPAYGVFPRLARRVGHMADSLVSRRPDHIITITERLRKTFLERGISPARISAVRPILNPQLFAEAPGGSLRSRFNLDSQPIVMYTGICSPLQRPDYLLRAFSTVVASEPTTKLLVLSPLESDPDVPRCRQLASELGIQRNVIWVQGHKLSELKDYLAIASMTVISRPDIPGLPIKFANSMMAGKPAVCFSGAVEGAEHLREAYIVPDHDWQALGKGMVTLLRNPELARAMGSRGRELVRRECNPAAFCEQIEAVYAQLLPAREMATRTSVAEFAD